MILGNLFFKTILLIIVMPTMGYVFWAIFESWFKLSKIYETNTSPPDIFFEYQTGLLGETRMKGSLNVGVVEQKLYLSHTSPMSNVIKPLLIDLDAITKVEFLDSAPLFNKAYQLYIGKPNITTLILSQDLIEILEQEYGEPIFSNKLGELN